MTRSLSAAVQRKQLSLFVNCARADMIAAVQYVMGGLLALHPEFGADDGYTEYATQGRPRLSSTQPFRNLWEEKNM